MAIDIVPALISDAPQLYPIGELAFKEDPLNMRLMDYASATPEQITEARAWRLERTKKRMTGEGKYFFKAIDNETGDIVGYAGAYTPEAAKSAMIGTAALKPEATGEKSNDLTPPAIFDGEFAQKVEKCMEETKKKYMGEKAEDVWYIGTMVVHPDHQGKGIGLRLLQTCTDLSDKAGKDMYLESSPAGRKLYMKGGFHDLGGVDIFGDGTADNRVMFHPCKTQ